MDVCLRCGAEGFADFPCFRCGEVIEVGPSDATPVPPAASPPPPAAPTPPSPSASPPPPAAPTPPSPAAPAPPAVAATPPAAVADGPQPPRRPEPPRRPGPAAASPRPAATTAPPSPAVTDPAIAAPPPPADAEEPRQTRSLADAFSGLRPDAIDRKAIVAAAAAGLLILLAVGGLVGRSILGGGGQEAAATLPFVEEEPADTVPAPSAMMLDAGFCDRPGPREAVAVDPRGSNLVATFQRIGTGPWVDETAATELFNQDFYDRRIELYDLPPLASLAPAFVACVETVGNSSSELRCTGYDSGQDHLVWGYQATVSLHVAATGELVATRTYDQVANECPRDVAAGSQGSVQRLSNWPIVRDFATYVVPSHDTLLYKIAEGSRERPSWCDDPTPSLAPDVGLLLGSDVGFVAKGDGGPIRFVMADGAGLPLALRQLGNSADATHVLCLTWTQSPDHGQLRCDYSRTNSVLLAVGTYDVKLVSLLTGETVAAAQFGAANDLCPDPRTAFFGTPLRMEADGSIVPWMEHLLAAAG